MQSTGIIRRVDDLGRVVIPREMRRNFGIPEGTPLEILVSEEGILLKKYDPEITVKDVVLNLEKAVDDNYVELGAEKTREIRLCIGDLKEILSGKRDAVN